MAQCPSIKEIVEFGLEKIPEARKVEVSLRDLVFVHQVLGELNRFFHQPLHYPNPEAIQEFLGSRRSGGGYEVLADAYYEKLSSMLPTDTVTQIEGAVFEHPEPPAYYKNGA